MWFKPSTVDNLQRCNILGCDVRSALLQPLLDIVEIIIAKLALASFYQSASSLVSLMSHSANSHLYPHHRLALSAGITNHGLFLFTKIGERIPVALTVNLSTHMKVLHPLVVCADIDINPRKRVQV